MVSVALVDPADPISADAVVVGVVPGAQGPRLARGAQALDAGLVKKLRQALETLGATGAAGEVHQVPTLGLAGFGLIVAAGLGEDAGSDESLRRAVGAAIRVLGSHARVHLAINGPVGALSEGAQFGSYRFTAYKSTPAKPTLRKVTIPVADDAAARTDLKRARVVAEALARTRDLVNTPANDLYPETFAARATEFATAARLDVEVLDERALKRGDYGAILAVGGGSVRAPRLVRIGYRPRRPRARVALVGKGITFDSGGLNLKTAQMEMMKSDMGGAAAVIASICAVAALRLPVEVFATVPMAENMPSGSAYRPSDVITMRSGHTVEVTNTDAEGRLVLADAIARAAEDEPEYLIEASTLTGAQLVSLGTRVIGAMGEPRWRDRVTAAGNAAGESVWSMPLPEDLRGGLDSSVADIANMPSDRWGGMLVAGQFLAEFMPENVPWVHLDIAGPSFNTGAAYGYTPTGGTGAGVRTMVAAIEQLTATQ